jgi:hypothetical protein
MTKEVNKAVAARRCRERIDTAIQAPEVSQIGTMPETIYYGKFSVISFFSFLFVVSLRPDADK